MRRSFGLIAALGAAFTLVAGTLVAGMACAQQIQEAPLPPTTGVSVPPTTGVSDPPPALPPASSTPHRQVAQQPSSSLTTQDCVSMPTPVEQTDCLNQLATDGNYMPTPKPAPGSLMPMEYRLSLGKRPVSPP